MTALRNIFRRRSHPQTHKNKNNSIVPSITVDESDGLRPEAAETAQAEQDFRALPSVASSSPVVTNASETTANPSWEELYASTSFVDKAFPSACSFVSSSFAEKRHDNESSSATAAHSFVSSHFKEHLSHTSFSNSYHQMGLQWEINETENGTAIVGATVEHAGENSVVLSFVFRHGSDEVKAVVQKGTEFEKALLVLFVIRNTESAVVVEDDGEAVDDEDHEPSPNTPVAMESSSPLRLTICDTILSRATESSSDMAPLVIEEDDATFSSQVSNWLAELPTSVVLSDTTETSSTQHLLPPAMIVGVENSIDRQSLSVEQDAPDTRSIESSEQFMFFVVQSSSMKVRLSVAILRRRNSFERRRRARGRGETYMWPWELSDATVFFSSSSSQQWASANRTGDGDHNRFVGAPGKLEAFLCSNRFTLLTFRFSSSSSSQWASANRTGDGDHSRCVGAPGKLQAFVCSIPFTLLTNWLFSFSSSQRWASANRTGGGGRNRFVVAPGKRQAFVCSIRVILLTDCLSSFSSSQHWASVNRTGGDGGHNRFVVAPGKLQSFVCSIRFTLLTNCFSSFSPSQRWAPANRTGDGDYNRCVGAPGKLQAFVCSIRFTLLTDCLSSFCSSQQWASVNRTGDGRHIRFFVTPGKLQAFVCSIRFALLTCCLFFPSSSQVLRTWSFEWQGKCTAGCSCFSQSLLLSTGTVGDGRSTPDDRLATPKGK